MLATKKLFLGFLITTFIAISTVSATVPCCDFTGTTCTWDSATWQQSPTYAPNTALYPGFGIPDPYYWWLQDKSGSVSATVDFTISAVNTVISLDYYFNTIDTITGDYLQVVFQSKSPFQPRKTLLSITTPADGWRSAEFTCDRSLDYCCGSQANIPCTGTFEIVGSLNTPTLQGLFAVNKFGECGVKTTTVNPITITTGVPLTTTASFTTESPTTAKPTTESPTDRTTTESTTTAYTLPPPVPAGCCHFQTNVCGVTALGWYWTATRPDPYLIPYYSGNYLWTDITSATAFSSPQNGIQYWTTFSVTYYVASTAGAIDVIFQETILPQRAIDTLVYTPGAWQLRTYSAYNLCTTGFPCYGVFSFRARPGGSAVAIDDIDRDGQCHGSYPCCYFDDPFYCNFINPGYLGNYWKWSGSSSPLNPPPYPGSAYVYFETVNYLGPEFSAPLESNVIEVSSSTTFTGNFFANTPFGPTGIEGLELTFIELTTGTATYMDYVKISYGNWMEVVFYCRSGHGECCQGLGPYCKGTLAFVAHVQTDGGTVLYGIDAISDGSCVPFPGLTMKSDSGNSTVIRLHA